jgi:hypothetical protein
LSRYSSFAFVKNGALRKIFLRHLRVLDGIVRVVVAGADREELGAEGS